MPPAASPSPQGPVVSDTPTIEEMSSALGGDGLFEALESDGDIPPTDPAPVNEDEDENPDPNNAGDPEGDEEELDPEESEDDLTDDPEQDDPAAGGQEIEPDQFAAMLGLDEGALTVDDDGQVLFKTKANGEEAETSLKDLVTSYQVRKALDQKSNALTEEHRTAMQTVTQQGVALQQQLQEAELLAQGALQSAMAEFEAVNWDDLKANDPAVYAAKRQDAGEKYQRIKAQIAGIQSKQEAATQTQLGEQAELRKGYLVEQKGKLLEAIPEWSNEEAFTKGQMETRAFLAEAGFEPDEIRGIVDHRQVLVIRKAMLYDQMQSKTKVARKKVAKVPKVVKPGAKQSQSQGSRVKAQRAGKRLSKSGSIDDAAAVFEGLMPDNF